MCVPLPQSWKRLLKDQKWTHQKQQLRTKLGQAATAIIAVLGLFLLVQLCWALHLCFVQWPALTVQTDLMRGWSRSVWLKSFSLASDFLFWPRACFCFLYTSPGFSPLWQWRSKGICSRYQKKSNVSLAYVFWWSQSSLRSWMVCRPFQVSLEPGNARTSSSWYKVENMRYFSRIVCRWTMLLALCSIWVLYFPDWFVRPSRSWYLCWLFSSLSKAGDIVPC